MGSQCTLNVCREFNPFHLTLNSLPHTLAASTVGHKVQLIHLLCEPFLNRFQGVVVDQELVHILFRNLYKVTHDRPIDIKVSHNEVEVIIANYVAHAARDTIKIDFFMMHVSLLYSSIFTHLKVFITL